jgi:hypothetical protein
MYYLKKKVDCLNFDICHRREDLTGVGNFATKHHYEIQIQVNLPPPFNGMLSLPVISPLYFLELIYILHLPADKDGAGGRPT